MSKPITLFVDWPDMRAIPVKDLVHACKWALDLVRAGHKLEVGCLGAHGRTGTFTAAMLICLGEAPKDAIVHVRASHCDRAIESVAQEKLLESLPKAVKKSQLTF